MKLMTVKDVAQFLSFSEETVRLKANSGEIPGKKIGKEWRFNPYELEKFSQSNNNNNANSAQGAIKENKSWHYIKEAKYTGLDLVTTVEEYNFQLKRLKSKKPSSSRRS